MKKRMLKDIFVSICVTTFASIIIVLIIGFLDCNFVSKEMMNNADEFVSQNTKSNLKADIESFESDDGVVEYQKKLIGVMYNAEETVYEEIAFSMVLSVVIGSIIGYLRNIMKLKQDKNNITKKIVLTYAVGLVLVEAVVGIINIVKYGVTCVDPILFISFGLYYTMVFVSFFLGNLGINIKKKNELNRLMKKENK